jgi:transketolase
MKAPFVRALMTLAREDPRLMFLTGDLGFGMIEPFVAEFPRQFLNVGVAEQNMLGVATGLALENRTVFTYSIGNFATLRCLEQIRNDAAYHDVNINVVSMGGGFSYGSLGISHHATEDLAILRAVPNVTVVAPGDDWEAEEATRALTRTPGVGYLRLDKTSAETDSHAAEPFQLGKARLLRDGLALTLIASGGGVLKNALAAADSLKEQGVDCRVLSMHTVKPLDTEAVFAAAKMTGGILTIEEHSVFGGLGGAVAEVCLEGGIIPKKFFRLGLRAGFSSAVGSQTYLQQRYGLDEDAIRNTVLLMIGSGAENMRTVAGVPAAAM